MTATNQCPAHADLEAEIETLRDQIRILTEQVNSITPANTFASLSRGVA